MKMAVAGARPSENNYRLNGIGVNDYANTTPGNALGTNLGVEAVAEFSVLTNSYSAEYGRTSGGVVNAITRSGTNQIRGTVFEFHRNSQMDARDYFDRGEQPPPFHRNQYGVAFGGPLIKNRTFWFGDYEGLREELGQTTISTTLSEAARQGRLAAGAVTVDPQIARALALYPLPNGPLLGNGDTGQYFAVRNKVSRGDYALGRIDHKLSTKGSLNATVVFDDADIEQPDAFLAKQVADRSRRHLVASEYSHTFGPAVVSVTRFGLSRSMSKSGEIAAVLNPALTDPSLGFIPGYNVGGISVPGLSGAGGGPGAVDYASLEFTSFQASQDVFVLRGRHSLKMGFNVERMRNDFDTPNLTGGSFNFGTLANFLRNVPSRFGALYPQSDTTRSMRETLIGGYIQDDLRLANTLTLNLGLRYEMMTIPTEVDGQVALLKGLTDPTVTVGGKIHDSNPTLRNFAPRIGVAWDPFGTRTTAVRGGIGVFDVLPFLYLYETPLNRSLPFFLQGNSLTPAPGSFPGEAFGRLNSQNLRTAWVDPNPPRAYRTQWNVDVQRQIGELDRRSGLRRRPRREPAARRAEHEHGDADPRRRPLGLSVAGHQHGAEPELLGHQHHRDVERGVHVSRPADGAEAQPARRPADAGGLHVEQEHRHRLVDLLGVVRHRLRELVLGGDAAAAGARARPLQLRRRPQLRRQLRVADPDRTARAPA